MIRERGPQQNVDDDYCACRMKAVGGMRYSYIRGPTFFLNRGPAKSKSGPVSANNARASATCVVHQLDAAT